MTKIITEKEKTIFKLWILDEVIEDKLDREIAGNMITDESFDIGLENWLETYRFFTQDQKDYIEKFAKEQIEDLDNTNLSGWEKDIFRGDI